MAYPVIAGAAYVLAHVPSLVRHGSKPARELPQSPDKLSHFLASLRSYDEALAYAPNQVFIGNSRPDDLHLVPQPWHRHPLSSPRRFSQRGEVMPEIEFLGLLKLADGFDLVRLEAGTAARARAALQQHPLLGHHDLSVLEGGLSRVEIQNLIASQRAVPIFADIDELAGCVLPAHDQDEALTAPVLLENLTCKTSGALAITHLLSATGMSPESVDYVLGCGEEAVGDRYQRGGGNLAKAMAEMAGCANATGSDLKAFCCSPAHAIVMAASLVQAKVFSNVVVVGGSSFAKLGMKFLGHLAKNMPILEDVLASVAVLVSADDGHSPTIRLDGVGKHDVRTGSTQQAIIEALVVRPLERLGLTMLDVDKFATELHNPEVTEPAGSGNVPRTNYRILGGLAALRGEIARSALDDFANSRGMPGYSPTQGHIASALPFIGHACDLMKEGSIERALFMAKGSLFLGRMTHMSDGMSFILERNNGRRQE